ncbi:VOC family protein [Lactococcus allomyrinae]|uniref:Thiol-disulfide isomerase n=1 Tax=Lactococcus allomyrinae TaxID=2419773 RepID=A0A387BL03_9LACT|nr:thiol-disulfide isomerase [Lactococcus allomyrinae]AYG01640.1 thiol-disulfide isomerase [Lactococcus allomyrinae]
MITLNVNSLENAEIFWKELGLEDEIALNEDFNCVPQTLAISVEYIDEIHDKVVALGLQVSPITESINGKHMFSFVAPEGNTFILIGEWVEAPYTSELRTEFFNNMENVEILPIEKLSALTEPAFVLFGRVTCPWTRRFVKQLPDFSDTKIYYIDTENTDINPDLQKVRQTYEAPTVPTFIKINADGTFVKFDSTKISLTDFIK